jgi:predicted secreted protein
MASAALSGVGTVFQRNSVAIAEVNSITGPTMTRDFIDVTSLDSTGGYREFITGFRDAGTISLSMNFTPASYLALKQDFESSVAQAYDIVIGNHPTHTTLSFEGLVTEIPITVPTDDKITVDCTIKISGKVFLDSESTGGF